MLKKKLLLFSIFLISILAISAVSAEENSTDVVEIAQDDNLTTTFKVNGNTFSDIQNTINSAKDGDIVELSGTYSGTNEIQVKKSLTFVGKDNAVLDAQSKSRAFHVYTSGVVFKDIKFINAKTEYSGGAIFREFGADYNFDVENCEFIGCSANYGSGGAIYGGNAYKCTFTNNSVQSGDGGAISSSIARECEFTNNYARSDGGSAAESIIECCRFTANRGIDGGALYNCNATDSVFRDNFAAYGGAIYSDFDSTRKYVRNCTFENNVATWDGGATFNAHVSDSIFINNTAEYRGGAVSGGEVDNCIFERNSASGELSYGTAIAGGAVSGSKKVKDSVFISNYATQYGGAVYVADVENSIFTNNTCGEYGGAVYNGYAKGSTFENNNAKNGGAIYISYANKKGSVEDSIFINNAAGENGGAVYAYDNNIINSRFKSNTAKGQGGAVYKCGNVENCEFTSNSADMGGALVVMGYSYKIENSNFTSNSANGDGGAIKSDEEYRSEVSNCNFAKNSANRGGAVYNIRVKYSNFTDNTAKQGSAMYSGHAEYCYFKLDEDRETYLTGVANSFVKANLSITQQGSHYNDKTLTFKVLSRYTGDGVRVGLNLKFSNGKTAHVTTNSNGVATYNMEFGQGTYSVTASVDSDLVICDSQTLNGITVEKAPIKISPTKLTTIYKSGKYFKVRVVNSKTNKPMDGIDFNLKIVTGKSSKTYSVTTDSDGMISFLSSKLSAGSHKVTVTCADANCVGSSATSTITINKIYPTLSMYTYKVTFGTDLTGKGFTIKDKNTKEPLKGIKVKVTFYINSKKKTTFNLVTDSSGKCAFFTNKYSVGSHKIIVTVSIPSTYKNAVDKRYKTIKKTSTYKLKSSQKFKLANTNKYFNIIYSNGNTSINS